MCNMTCAHTCRASLLPTFRWLLILFIPAACILVKSKEVPCHGYAHIIMHFALSSLAVTLLCPRHVAPRCAKPHDKALRHAPAELFTGARDFQSDCGVRGVLN